VDGHMHFWNIRDTPQPGAHSPQILAGMLERFGTYEQKEYLANIAETGIVLRKGVFVEGISTDVIKEAHWVDSLIKRSEMAAIPFGLVLGANLSTDNFEDALKTYSKISAARGVRQILNHHPKNPSLTWPNVTEDFLLNEKFRNNYKLLKNTTFHLIYKLTHTK